MNNNVLILEIGGEGGSIRLITDGRLFLYSSDETTMLDILAGEFTETELKHSSPVFFTFDDAFTSLMERYPVFHLHPLTVHPKYLEQIQSNFFKYKSANIKGHQWGFDKWEKFLEF